MIGGAVPYDSKQHYLLPRSHNIVQWCIRETNNEHFKDNLFLYHHKGTGNFVIGCWLEERALLVDLLNLGPSLAGFTRSKAQEFLTRSLRPRTARQKQREIIDLTSEHLGQLSEAHDKEIERLERNGVYFEGKKPKIQVQR